MAVVVVGSGGSSCSSGKQNLSSGSFLARSRAWRLEICSRLLSGRMLPMAGAQVAGSARSASSEASSFSLALGSGGYGGPCGFCKRGRNHPQTITKGRMASTPCLKFVSDSGDTCAPCRWYLKFKPTVDKAALRTTTAGSKVHEEYMVGLQAYEERINASANGYIRHSIEDMDGLERQVVARQTASLRGTELVGVWWRQADYERIRKKKSEAQVIHVPRQAWDFDGRV